MRILSMQHIEMSYPGVFLFQFERLDIHTGDRIGLVGANGAGKSTLLQLMTGALSPDAGRVISEGRIKMMPQFFTPSLECRPDPKLSGQWGVHQLTDQSIGDLSGGEAGRRRLAEIFSSDADCLLFDEPSANLDEEGRALLLAALKQVPTFVLISHDRALLDACTNRTLAIREGTLLDYPGHYGAYADWLATDLDRRMAEYEVYCAEKKRLENVVRSQKARAQKTEKAPRSMSSSERKGRAYGAVGKSIGGKSKHLNRAARHTEKRIAQMEEKKRPPREVAIRPDFQLTQPPMNPVVLSLHDFSFSRPGEKPLFSKVNLQLKRGEKVALMGANGSGKTTLLKCLMEDADGVRKVPKAQLGYFRQDLSSLVPEESILQNMRRVSVQDEQVMHHVLVRMGFDRDRLQQKSGSLSGGEKVKLQLAMLFVSAANVLILDEVTNFLDLPSLEAVEQFLTDYEGTVLFVSHDEAFVAQVATAVWRIDGDSVLEEQVSL